MKNINEFYPLLRFDGFTDSWSLKNMLQLANVYDGVHQTPNYKTSGVMFLSVENIKSLKSNKFISEEDFQSNFKIYPEYGDVLMTRIGDVGTPNVYEDRTKVAFYVSLALLKPKTIDSYFFNYDLQSNSSQKSIKEHSLTTAVPQKINKDEIGKIDLYISNNDEEQQKIGTLFRKIDSLINSYEDKSKKLRSIKYSLLEAMFPSINKTEPVIRLNGYVKPWGPIRLGDECKIFAGGTPSTSIKEYWENGDVYWLPSGNVQDCVIDAKDIKTKITKKGLENSAAQIIKPNTALLAMTGATCGKSGFLTCASAANQSVMAFETTALDSKFLFYTFQKNKSRILQLQAGGGQAGINKTTCSNFTFLFPEKNEQIEIATLLSKVNELINLYEVKFKKLKSLKQALLQDMFI